MKKGNGVPIAAITVLLLQTGIWTAIAYAADYREGGDKDYFNIVDPRDKTLLYNVEKYHLGQDNFWSWAMAGKYKFAMEDLKFALRYFPNHPDALSLLGMIAKATKDPSLPIDYYQKALSLYPQHPVTHAQFGIYLTEIGLTADGIGQLKTAVELGPNLGVAHAGLAQAYKKEGKKDLARTSAERARELGYTGNLIEGILEEPGGKVTN